MSDTISRTAIRTLSKVVLTDYEVMFDRDIEAPNEFQEEFYAMRKAEKNENVTVRINSMGGACATISTFQNIIKNSEAHFHGVLEGYAFSAGSAMFLLCDSHEVSDLAEMMIHTSNQGLRTHSQGMEEFGKQTGRSARIMIESVYKDFLTQEEIEKILLGAEMWLDANQIRERLKIREEARELRQREEDRKKVSVEAYALSCIDDVIADCDYYDMSFSEMLAELTKAYAKKTMTDEEYQEFLGSLNTEIEKAVAEEEEEAPVELESEEVEVPTTSPYKISLYHEGIHLKDVDLIKNTTRGNHVEIVAGVPNQKYTIVTTITKNLIEDEDGQIESLLSEEFIDSFGKEEDFSKYLRAFAKELGIPFASNIGNQTLGKRVMSVIRDLQSRL